MRLRHLAVAVAVTLGATACSSGDDGPIHCGPLCRDLVRLGAAEERAAFQVIGAVALLALLIGGAAWVAARRAARASALAAVAAALFAPDVVDLVRALGRDERVPADRVTDAGDRLDAALAVVAAARQDRAVRRLWGERIDAATRGLAPYADGRWPALRAFAREPQRELTG